MDQTEDPKMDMPKDPSKEGSTKPDGQSGDQGSGSGAGQGSGGKESESDKDDEAR
jgi:hypothetical protein